MKEEPARAVFTRLGWSDDAVYFDLADEGGHVVKVTTGGWQVVTETEVRFLRHLNVLPMPTDGDLSDLLDHRFVLVELKPIVTTYL